MTYAQKVKAELQRRLKKAEQFRRAVILALLRKILLRTPVLLGILRGGWTTSVGAPALSRNLGARTPEAVIAEAQVALAGLTGDAIVWIANFVDYANHVENGTSRMAPRHMLLQSVIEMREKLRAKGATL